MSHCKLLVLLCTPWLPGQEAAPVLARMQGRIVDERGEPVPAARLEVTRAGQPPRKAATDATGRFLVPQILAGTVSVRIVAPGKAELRAHQHLDAGTNAVGWELRDAAPLRGRVADADGRAVGHAVVVLLAGSVLETSADAEGRFEFRAAAVGAGTVRAYGPRSFAQRTVVVGAEAAVDLVLPAAGAESRLVRVLGLPRTVPAQVRLVAWDGALSPRQGRVQVGQDGVAEVRIMGTTLVQLEAPGFVTTPPGLLLENVARHPVEFRVAAAPPTQPFRTSLRGRCVDDEERPVGGLALRVETLDDRVVGAGVVQADGRFEVAIAAPQQGPCRICVQRRGWVVSEPGAQLRGGDSVVLQPFFPADEFVLAMARTGDLEVLAATGDGERAALQPVHLARLDAPVDSFVSVATDGDGRFELLGLPPDDYLLRCRTEAGVLLRAVARVRAGQRTTVRRWEQTVGGIVEGVVRDRTGAGVPGCTVRVWLQDAPHAEVAMAPHWRTVRTDRAGRFRAASLPPGAWWVECDVDGDFAQVHVDVRPGGRAAADLRPGPVGQRPEAPRDGSR